MSSVDMSLPLASVLKAGTIKAHEIAEHSSGASRLVNGELDRDEYVKFLMALWYVYQ